MKPLLAATATATAATDEQLVAAARDGSDEAFEALFRRYRDRVVGYVRGMVSDHGRAEDIVQEAFMSALRALRRSDQEIVFRPWIYEIAKNACIDHLRRARRAQEVSIDSDDFSPVEEGRISQAAAGTDATVARRNELKSLRMAFDDLPRSQHQILVMRELEGLSYDSIGTRMGLTRGAVESMLFRARRRLRTGFDEIDTGARCQSTRATMEALVDGTARARERRRVSSHLHHCKSCRRAAVALGLDSLALGAERGPFHRAAALLPLPAFLRRRLEDPSLFAPAAQAGVEHGPTLAGKATAVVVAAALCAGGVGVTHKAVQGGLPLVGGSAQSGERGDGRAGSDAPDGPGDNGAATGQGFDDQGRALAGSGDPGAPGAARGPGQGPVLGPGGLPGPGGPVGPVPGAQVVGTVGGTAVDAVERLGAGGAPQTIGETVEQAPAKVDKQVKAEQKALDKATKKVTAPMADTIKGKAPKIKVKKPNGGGGGPAVSAPIELPGTQPPVGPTGLTAPTVLPRTGLGL